MDSFNFLQIQTDNVQAQHFSWLRLALTIYWLGIILNLDFKERKRLQNTNWRKCAFEHKA